MEKTYALSLEQVSLLKNILAPDIIESPVLENAKVFEDLMIKVIPAVEFKRTDMIFRRKAGGARKYDPKNLHKDTVGYIEERPLKVEQAVAFYEENLQKFREKEPFSVQGSNQTFEAPVSEFLLRQIGKAYAEDVLNCLFFGDHSLDNSPLNLYDGYWTQINREINEGKISIKNKNLIQTEAFAKTPDQEVGDIYQQFVDAVESLDDHLRNAEKLVVYLSAATKRLIVQDYMKAFPNAFTSTTDGGFQFIDMPNIILKSHAILGRGDKMIFTVPENLQFGLDDESDWNAVHMTHDQNDQNNLIFQVQSTQGVRVLDTSKKKFAVTTGTSEMIDDLVGDYTNNTISALTNDAELGEVTVSPAKDDYAAGETVTLTATAKDGAKFQAWSDGATLNPRTYVAQGAPMVFQAVFAKDAE
jgi:hypothetical protein